MNVVQVYWDSYEKEKFKTKSGKWNLEEIARECERELEKRWEAAFVKLL